MATDGEREGGLEQRVRRTQEDRKSRPVVYLKALRAMSEDHKGGDPYQTLFEVLGRNEYGTVESQGTTGFVYMPLTPEGRELGETFLKIAKAYASVVNEDPLNPMEFTRDGSTEITYHFANVPNSQVYQRLVEILPTFVAQCNAYSTRIGVR